MKAEDIVDQETFEAWLKVMPLTVAQTDWLYARAALRTFPWAWVADKDHKRLAAIRQALRFHLRAVSYSYDSTKLQHFLSAKNEAEQHLQTAFTALLSLTDELVFPSGVDPEDAEGLVWQEISEDCVTLFRHEVSPELKLWRKAGSPFEGVWHAENFLLLDDQSRAVISDSNSSDWAFWMEWYNDILAGRPCNISMMEEIALEVDWDQAPGGVLAQINAIVAKHRNAEQDKNEAVQIDVFRATLFDFSYDALEGVMRAVPLARDWKHLDDPDLLAAFLLDAEELREDLQLFCDALAAEGTAMQGAGIVRTYCTALLSELKKAEAAGNLRVGKLVQYGRMIENARLDPATQKEFGLLAPALQDNGKAVLDLMRNHFARTLSRFAELRDVGIEDDATHWEVLQGFRDLVRAIQSEGADRPPLAKEDAVVLSDIMESVERQLRAMDSTDDDSVLDSLRREVNFELAKLGATIAIFRERAVSSEKDLGEAADVALKWQKRGLGLWGIVKMLKKGLGVE